MNKLIGIRSTKICFHTNHAWYENYAYRKMNTDTLIRKESYVFA